MSNIDISHRNAQRFEQSMHAINAEKGQMEAKQKHDLEEVRGILLPKLMCWSEPMIYAPTETSLLPLLP